MFTRKVFLSCISASALALSAPIWAQNAPVLPDGNSDHDIFADEGDSFSVRPVIEYNFGREGEFTTGGGNAGTFELEDGYGLGVDIVYQEDGSNWRVEGNLRYRKAGIEGITYGQLDGSETPDSILQGVNDSVATSGQIHEIVGGVSAWYEFDTGNDFTPYVGGGVHYSHSILDEVAVSAGGRTASYDDNGGALGLVIGGGVSVPVTDSINLSADYRYSRSVTEYEFEGVSSGEDTTLNVENLAGHAVMIGANISF